MTYWKSTSDQLENNLKIVNFNKIDTDLPEITSDRSTDQSNLYDMCKAILPGSVSKFLPNRLEILLLIKFYKGHIIIIWFIIYKIHLPFTMVDHG